MKLVTVKFTPDQANYLINTMVLHDDLPISHPDNQFIIRIEEKITNAIKASYDRQ